MSIGISLTFLSMILVILFLGCYTFYRLKGAWTYKTLFRDFKRKMCMTIGLGLTFSCVYILIVALCMLLTHQWKAELISFISLHRVECIYAALGLFILMSLSVYLARMIVKYLYLTRGKD